MSESTPKETTIASLFDQLEAFGAGSMHLTAADKDGKVLSGVLDEDDEWMDDDDD